MMMIYWVMIMFKYVEYSSTPNVNTKKIVKPIKPQKN